MSNAVSSDLTLDGQGIANKAAEVARLVEGKKYRWGGKTTDGFDCSGFVSYVFKQLYPNAASAFSMNVDGYISSTLFEDVEEADRQPGDLIIFPSEQGLVNHIGIVLDDTGWIGAQSSTGVKVVAFTNTWWGKRTKRYRRLKSSSPKAASLGRSVLWAYA